MKTEKQRQQGHILILNYIYVLRIQEKTIKKETHKNRELVDYMLLILLDVIRHFRGPRMYKSNVNHKNHKNQKGKYCYSHTYQLQQ